MATIITVDGQQLTEEEARIVYLGIHLIRISLNKKDESPEEEKIKGILKGLERVWPAP